MDEAALASRFALGLIFLLAGLSKLPNLREFERVVRDYKVGPAAFARTIAIAIPAVETIAGISLLLGIATRAAGVLVASLLLLFSTAISVNLIRGRRISCGCFGTVARREISLFAVVRNLLFMALAVVTIVWAPNVLSVEALGGSSSSLSDADGLAMLVTGTVAALMLAIAQETVAVLRSGKVIYERRVRTS